MFFNECSLVKESFGKGVQKLRPNLEKLPFTGTCRSTILRRLPNNCLL